MRDEPSPLHYYFLPILFPTILPVQSWGFLMLQVTCDGRLIDDHDFGWAVRVWHLGDSLHREADSA